MLAMNEIDIDKRLAMIAQSERGVEGELRKSTTMVEPVTKFL